MIEVYSDPSQVVLLMTLSNTQRYNDQAEWIPAVSSEIPNKSYSAAFCVPGTVIAPSTD